MLLLSDSALTSTESGIKSATRDKQGSEESVNSEGAHFSEVLGKRGVEVGGWRPNQI